MDNKREIELDVLAFNFIEHVNDFRSSLHEAWSMTINDSITAPLTEQEELEVWDKIGKMLREWAKKDQ